MKNLTILLIEPSVAEAGLLAAALERLDLKVHAVHDGDAAIALLSTPQPVHLVLANWIQSGSSGLEMAEAVRLAARVQVPVVLYSRTMDDEAEKACAQHGVAALLRSPMSQSDLYQHLHPILRDRHPWAFPAKSVIGDLELDRERYTVERRGKRVHLTPNEFRILEALTRRPGEVLSREELHAAFSRSEGGNIRAVDVHIQRLKMALTVGGSTPPITAVRGKGYKIA